ncbi:MAG: HK97 gp10 family phage protein, partial [Clostridia bacterium]|nr:HK97 gp10 family phage protein [Clostridia bacterium]
IQEDRQVGVEFTDNSAKFLSELERKKRVILTEIKSDAVKYAKDLCPVGTEESTGIKGYPGGTLRRSIRGRIVNGDTLEVGSNVEYAPYVELGTGPHFVPPPEWERFEAEKGKGVGKAYVKPRPFIRPAIEDHRDEYQRITETILKGG